MGSFANSLFTALMGWMKSVISSIWSLFTEEKGGGFLRWIGDHWLAVALFLCVTGLLLDLLVYLFRWRPYLVWKSFRNRMKHGDEAVSGEEREAGLPGAPVQAVPLSVEKRKTTEPAGNTIRDRSRIRETAEDELARWKKEPETTPEKAPERAPLVTAAGYVVPDDSPYRRPAEKRTETNAKRKDYAFPEEADDGEPPSVRRRRRLKVNSLLSAPEEELMEFDAPQSLIDRNKAYRDPVYPRNWNEGKEKKE